MTMVSVILSTNGTPVRPMPIAIQISTLHNRTVASARRAYNGSTKDGDFDVRFEDVHLRTGHVYILRVANNSPGKIFVYTHYLDRTQVVPLSAAACEYN